MERKFKRQQRTIGALVQVPLKSGFHAYARILEEEIAFYDIYTKNDLPEDEIIKLPILFITTVIDDAITKGFWPKVSKAIPLTKDLIETPPKYTQNRLNLSKYKIHYTSKTVQATKEECIGLECWIIWSAEQMEKRLNDHYTGKKNPYVEHIKRAEMYSDKKPAKKIKLHNNINKEAV